MKRRRSTGIVQFRADDALLSRLTKVAQRLAMPVGALARLWITERLEKELSLDFAEIDSWITSRYKQLRHTLPNDFEPGPYQIIHLVPIELQREIDLDRVRTLLGVLPPFPGVDEYFGQINLDGFCTVKQFRSQSKIAGKAQVYRNGRIEAVRDLWHDETRMIFLDRLESDLIATIWSYASALEFLGVMPPVVVSIGFLDMRGIRFKSRHFSQDTRAIDVNEFRLETLTLNSWDAVGRINGVAAFLKKDLDQLANAAGVARSPSFASTGEWLGPEDPARVPDIRLNAPRTPVVERLELSGLGETPSRIELSLLDSGKTLVAGKVRKPSVYIDGHTTVRCLVLEREIEPLARETIRNAASSERTVKFAVANQRFEGQIKNLQQTYAGRFDGFHLNLEQNKIWSFEVIPVIDWEQLR